MRNKQKRLRSSQRGSNSITRQIIKKSAIEAITDGEIEVYVDPFPFKMLTEKEKQQAREEISIWKNGGFVLDGLIAKLENDERFFQ